MTDDNRWYSKFTMYGMYSDSEALPIVSASGTGVSCFRAAWVCIRHAHLRLRETSNVQKGRDPQPPCAGDERTAAQ
ncbi:hypothetical protein L226DRAFT_294682 [Lentinus tigrinus ALCF2SS1-7]|uniref:uncharacterized protein n=1 Tax=Lentinus tigrinus ALCF2SS1-7 TaxID=1328758 RepID=UPI0011662D4F|nr:hypothetical protein L226DRAFT_294682 [Lentinus tigrinus ALCF2SS1-7]